MARVERHTLLKSKLLCAALALLLVLTPVALNATFVFADTDQEDISDEAAQLMNLESTAVSEEGDYQSAADSDPEESDESEVSEAIAAASTVEQLLIEPLEVGDEYTATIDLSCTTNSTGTGYSVTGVAYPFDPRFLETAPVGSLTFNSNAQGNSYRIIQTGTPNSGVVSPKGPKYGTSLFSVISIPTAVEITLVISEIDLLGNITLNGTARLTLLLDDTSFIRGCIAVPSAAELTLDSLRGGAGAGNLVMTSEPNSTSSSAKIGSSGNSNTAAGNTCGTVTINGGTIDITVRSRGAGIGGGGSGSYNSNSGDGGTITINGGNVSVTQYGSGNDQGTGFSGAGIGGGGGTSSGSGNAGGTAGNVLITGGTVTVRQYSRAPGIGGGTFGTMGNITIDGGVVDVAVIQNSGASGGGEGAGIGGCSGSTGTGTGYITINGGSVRSVATMTGIGIVHGPLRCDITITGGTVFAQGKDGPGIGNWATPTGSTITITGGTVVAQSESNAGIGGAASSEPAFNLGPEAHVRAYSGGATPAINTLDNTGSGYFVNARFNAVLSSSAAATLYVCSQGSPGTVLKTLSLPANYKNFAYSSQTEVAQTDNLFAQSVSAGLVPVVRAADNSPAIYSIKARAGYNSHNSNANNGLLPVQPGSDTYYTITEKYVDTFGSPLAGQSDAMTLIVSGGSYSKAIPAIPDFIVKGSKWDTSPDNSGADYTRGSLVSTTVSGSRDLYLVYAPYLVTDVTVSKTVCGDFADRAYAFAFTVYFADDERTALPAGTTISYTGGVIPGSGATLPQADLLTLDAEGKTSITLAHGQTVTFIDLLSENWIRVEETVNDNYYTSFWDSADASDTSDNDTDYRCIGTVARTFDFENVRSTVEDMGVLAGRRLASLLLAAALALIVPAHQVVKGLMREKRNYE